MMKKITALLLTMVFLASNVSAQGLFFGGHKAQGGELVFIAGQPDIIEGMTFAVHSTSYIEGALYEVQNTAIITEGWFELNTNSSEKVAIVVYDSSGKLIDYASVNSTSVGFNKFIFAGNKRVTKGSEIRICHWFGGGSIAARRANGTTTRRSYYRYYNYANYNGVPPDPFGATANEKWETRMYLNGISTK